MPAEVYQLFSSSKGNCCLIKNGNDVFLIDAGVSAKRIEAAVKQVGIEWATMQARELKAAGLPVIHFYTMSRTDNVAQIVKNVF